MSDEVIVEQSVTIAAPQQAVFDFVTEYSNDPQWRTEAQRMEYPRPLQVGDVVVEHAEFQGHTLVTRTALIERKKYSATLETPNGESAHLVNVRTVTAIDDNASHFTYRLEFDREILRPVMPQLPPAEEITAWYGAVVEAYLEALKGILECGLAADNPSGYVSRAVDGCACSGVNQVGGVVGRSGIANAGCSCGLGRRGAYDLRVTTETFDRGSPRCSSLSCDVGSRRCRRSARSRWRQELAICPRAQSSQSIDCQLIHWLP
jgi:hypothetical protein